MSHAAAQLARERISELEVDLARWRRVLDASTEVDLVAAPGVFSTAAGIDEPRPTPTIADVINVVAERYGVTPADIRGDSRQGSVPTARHVAMRLARELTGESFPRIGRAFNRDHSTVMYGCRQVEGFALGDLREQLTGVEA